MIVQRLQAKGTLSQTVQWLRQNGAVSWLEPCKRVREQRISAATGGYCQARMKLSTLVVRQVSEEMQERLRNQLSKAWPGLEKPVFVVDGSSLELVHTQELVRTFPPAENQHGSAHWPVLRLVVMHDLSSGLAEQACWGAMYGKQAVSEQALAEQAVERLPGDAVVLADGNFGIFAFAYAVMGQIRAHGSVFSGPATGRRFQVESNGTIFTQGGGANFFPGNADGIIDGHGGEYV